MYSGCDENEANHYGVAIAVRTDLIKKGLISEPTCYNDRLMTIQVSGENIKTIVICCYAPTLNAPELTKELFYEHLGRIVGNVTKGDDIIIAGDMNARIGKSNFLWKNIIGKHGVGQRNGNGLQLLQFCSQYNLRVMNTFFQQKNIHKYTWQHPRSKQWHLLDYIIVRSHQTKKVLRCRVMRSAQCETDHRLVRAAIRFIPTIRKYANTKKPVIIDVHQLQDQDTRQRFQNKLESQELIRDLDVEQEWSNLKNAYLISANDSLGKRRVKRWDWFEESNQDIDSVLKKRHEAHMKHLANPNEQTKKKYANARKLCQKEVRCIKDQWWKKKMEELQTFIDENDSHSLYDGIKKIVGPVKKPLTIVKDAEGNEIKEKEKQLTRWNEHFQDVLNQPNTVQLCSLASIDPNLIAPNPDVFDGPPNQQEIKDAICQLKNRKSPGEDSIPAELLKAGGNVSVERLESLFQNIWKSKAVPQDWRNAVIVPLYKKGSKSECNNYRGISLLSVPGKVLTRIICNRLEPYLDKILRDGQCGFRRKRSTIDMIFSTRQLIEKSLEQQKALCLAFIDIKKAFDSVNREMLCTILKKVNCPPNLLAIIKSLHESTCAMVKYDGDLSKPFHVNTGVRQGCVLAPLLFLLYIHIIISRTIQEAKDGVHISYRNDSNLFN